MRHFVSVVVTALVLFGCSGQEREQKTTNTVNEVSATNVVDAVGVEIRLVDAIDEERGYCIDIAGGKGERAPLDRGLQAHTCYDYTGELLVDQTFDASLLINGQFKFPFFDVCMTASTAQEGAALDLAACVGSELQQFTLSDSGVLTLQSNPDLCVTVSGTEKREGRGGTPVHVMRPITLQTCSDANSTYQKWEQFSL